jgi:hypothetical protein
MEGALRGLLDTAMPRSEVVRSSRLSISVFHHGDEEQLRLGEPTLAPAFRESMLEYERKVSTCLSEVKDMLQLLPHEPSMTVKQVGLETTELMAMAPRGCTLEQVRRGLVIAEFEDMVGYVADEEGGPVSHNAWDMDEVATELYAYHEEHSAEALRDVLTKALLMQPKVGWFVLQRLLHVYMHAYTHARLLWKYENKVTCMYT